MKKVSYICFACFTLYFYSCQSKSGYENKTEHMNIKINNSELTKEEIDMSMEEFDKKQMEDIRKESESIQKEIVKKNQFPFSAEKDGIKKD